MPISADEFRKGKALSPLSRRVLEFLKSHPESAYTEYEVMQALYPDIASAGSADLDRLTAQSRFLTEVTPLLYDGQVTMSHVVKSGVPDFYYKIA